MNDLQIIYDELQIRQSLLNSYYNILNSSHKEAQLLVNDFLKIVGLKENKENILVALNRVIGLREDSLSEALKKLNLTEDEKFHKKEQAYLFVSRFYINEFENFMIWMREKSLLNEFYWTIIQGVHAVGIAMSGWQSSWTSHIINGVNRELFQLFNGDEEKIFQKLQDDSLLDLNQYNDVGDRCYSVLIKDHMGNYKSVSYKEAFSDEVNNIVNTLDVVIDSLSEKVDTVFNQKEQWINYLLAIKNAFNHINKDELIEYWAKVDECWMAITSPIQLGHPLEYYEDHYRKAVALEWDLRIINPSLNSNSNTKDNIKKFALSMAENIGEDALKIIENNIIQVDKVQLYIGRPMFFYGAEFNGLFSAQVVPNDESVSSKLGKKIFAYSDFVLESKKAKPTMKLSVEFFEKEFILNQKDFISRETSLWHKIYDITTIGHEFGHILWIDNTTETSMNKSGQFKNIEEFKATVGGLMAFFANDEKPLREHIINDIVTRAVGLMAWREVGEVQPYYCEGLMHLDILFQSKVIKFTKTIEIDYSQYKKMRKLYTKAYMKLVHHYIDKKDANIYLSDYAFKYNGVYLPKNEVVRSFVEKYYERYQEIGQVTVKI